MSISDLNRELLGVKELVDDVFPHFLGGQLKGLPGIDSISIKHAWPGMEAEDQFSDTLMFDARTHQFRTFRSLRFQSEHGNISYAVELYKSTTPADKLVEQVTLIDDCDGDPIPRRYIFPEQVYFCQPLEGFFRCPGKIETV